MVCLVIPILLLWFLSGCRQKTCGVPFSRMMSKPSGVIYVSVWKSRSAEAVIAPAKFFPPLPYLPAPSHYRKSCPVHHLQFREDRHMPGKVRVIKENVGGLFYPRECAAMVSLSKQIRNGMNKANTYLERKKTQCAPPEALCVRNTNQEHTLLVQYTMKKLKMIYSEIK